MGRTAEDRSQGHEPEVVEPGAISRRHLMQRAAALGVSAPLLAAVMARAASPVAAAPSGAQATPKPGGTLTAIVVDDPKSLDIHITQLAQSRNVMASVYETLTFLDPTDFVTKGRLASAWEFTTPTTLEMTLREGVTFHGGQPFTAEDVTFTIEYVRDPGTGSPNASILEQIDTVEAVDPLTVRFNLKAAWPALIDDLSTIQIYSATSTIASISTSPNGTGPFTWTEWIPGDHITLSKNPAY